jgi:excisionase family DNA binding protein
MSRSADWCRPANDKETQMSNSGTQVLLTEEEAAKRLAISKRTLQAWRSRGGGPRFIKLNSAVRYSETALNDYIAAGMRSNTSEVA